MTASLFGFLWLLALPFLVPMVIAADPTRRAAVLVGGAQLLGGSIGPLFVSFIVTDTDVSGSLGFGAVVMTIALLIVVALHLRERSAASSVMQTRDFHIPDQWTLQQTEKSGALYQNTDGDILAIYHFRKVPDIAADISDAAALRTFYRRVAETNGIAMIEVDPVQIAGLPAVRTLLKVRLEPTGFAFIGSYTLPFADCSYVLRFQSVERGITGAREAAVLMIEESHIEADEQTGKMIGWEQDPYEPSHRGSFMRNRADDAKYDDAFPDHPLSKVRRYLQEVAQQLDVAPSIRALVPFKYKEPKLSFWSRLWN